MTNISLDPALHRHLSDFFGVDLPPLQLPTGPGCRHDLPDRRATALTVDGRIIVAHETYRPGSFSEPGLLAHEVANTRQQTISGPLPPGWAPCPLAEGEPWERATPEAGLDFVPGRHPWPGAE
jgi:Domain of unknown function (DUF4157)